MAAVEVTLQAQEFDTSTTRKRKRKARSHLIWTLQCLIKVKLCNNNYHRSSNRYPKTKTWETLIGLTHLHRNKVNEAIQSLAWRRLIEAGASQCHTEWARWIIFRARVALARCLTMSDQEISLQTSDLSNTRCNLCMPKIIWVTIRDPCRAKRRVTLSRASNILVMDEKLRCVSEK